MRGYLKFLLTALIAVVINNQEIQEIKENTLVKVQLNKNETKYYSFNADSVTHSEIQVIGSQIENTIPMKNFKIYFSESEKYPSEEKHEQKCENENNFEPCLFNTNRKRMKVQLGVECKEACWFQLQVIYKELLKVEEGKRVQMWMGEEQTQNVQLGLSSQQKYDYLVVWVEVVRMGDQYLDLGIDFSTKVQVGHSYVSSELAIYILDKKQQNSWCSHCYIGMQVKGGSESVLLIGVQERKYNQTTMNIDTGLVDYVTATSSRVYRLSGVNPQPHDLQVTLHSLSGAHKQLYINPHYFPSSLSKYTYVTNPLSTQLNSKIVVPSNQLVQQQVNSESNVYIVVTSRYEGFYRLEAQQSPSTPQLRLGETVDSQVAAHLLQHYYLQVHPQKHKQQVDIHLFIQSATLSIYIRKCASSALCSPITQQDIQSNTNIHLQLKQMAGTQQLALDIKCGQYNNQQCYFQIAIEGGQRGAFYSITAIHHSGLLLLEQDRPLQLQLESGQEQLVQYQIQQKQIEYKLQFIVSSEQVTMEAYWGNCSLQGTLDLTSSDCHSLRGDSLTPILLTSHHLQHSTKRLILKLYAHQTTTFRLEVQQSYSQTQIHQHSNLQQHVLYEGMTYDYLLTKQQHIQWFRLQVDLKEDSDIIIKINKIDKEKIIMRGKRERVASESEYDWISKGLGYLVISKRSNPEQYCRHTSYSIQVEYDQEITQTLIFQIKYYHLHSVHHLPLNTLHTLTLQPHQHQLYQLYLDHQPLSLITTILKTYNNNNTNNNNTNNNNNNNNNNNSSHLRVQLSGVGDLPSVDDESVYSREQRNEHEWVQMQMSREMIREVCLKQIHNKCNGYIQVMNPNDYTVDALLQLIQPHQPLHMIQAHKYYFSLLQQHIATAYIIPQATTSHFQLICKNNRQLPFNVRITLLNYRFKLETHQVTSMHKALHYIQINKQVLQGCQPTCSIHLQMDYNSTSMHNNTLNKQEVNNEVEVIGLGEMTELFENKGQTFSLSYESGNYFKVQVDPKKNITVNLHKYLGSAYMVYTLCLDDDLHLPSPTDYDYSHRRYVTVYDAQFTLSSQHILQQITNHVYHKVYLILGVFQNQYYLHDKSANNGLFQIQWRNSNYPFIHLNLQVINPVQIDSNQIQYYQLNEYQSGVQLQIQFSRDNGQNYTINHLFCSAQMSILDCQQQLDNKLIQFQNKQQINYFTQPSTPHTLLIKIQAGGQQLGGQLMVIQNGQPLQLTEGQRVIQKIEKNHYQIYKLYQQVNPQLLDVKLNLFSGKVKVWLLENYNINGNNSNNSISDISEIVGNKSIKHVKVEDKKSQSNNNLVELLLHEEEIRREEWWYQQFQALYLLVGGLEDSHFSLGYSNQPSSNTLLSLHHLYKTTLQPNATQLLSILTSTLNTQQHLYVDIMLPQHQIDTLSITFQVKNQIHQFKQQYQQNPFEQNIYLNYIPTNYGSQFIQYQLNNKWWKHYNIIEIQISNGNTVAVEMQVKVNNQQEVIVPPTNQMMVFNQSHLSIDIPKQGGILAIQYTNCRGNLVYTLQQNNNINNNNNNNINNINNNINNNNVQSEVQYIEVEGGALQISLQNNTQSTPNPFGHLSTQLMNESEYNQLVRLLAPNEVPQVTTSSLHLHNTQLSIRFTPLTCQHCPSNTIVNYILTVSDYKPYLLQHHKCGLYTPPQQTYYKQKILLQKQIQMVRDGWLVGQMQVEYTGGNTLYLQLEGQTTHSLNGDQMHFYQLIELDLPTWHQRQGSQLFMFFLSIVILFTFVLLYKYHRRNKILTNRLHYEVTEVRQQAPHFVYAKDTSNNQVQMVSYKGYDQMLEDKL